MEKEAIIRNIENNIIINLSDDMHKSKNYEDVKERLVSLIYNKYIKESQKEVYRKCLDIVTSEYTVPVDFLIEQELNKLTK